ncbi:hypothetical protein WJ33_18920 [Burkholderia ubonensis]|uniref:Uncharacterized protein n=1 Tax=Burkholderia ubonensis TaxID=101571 RepID=A0A103RQP8_9BURK|nr:hypothetical protein WJ33_18920 [Burkholderia ubonensis]
MCVAAVLSLSVHAVMLQLFHAPYPGASLGSKLPAVVNDAVMIYASSWLYRSLCLSLPLRSRLCRITVLFMILAGLNETLRMRSFDDAPQRLRVAGMLQGMRVA